MVIELIN